MSKDQYNVTKIQNDGNVCSRESSVMIPMRDGVRLHAMIYFPEKMETKAPVLLVASPYNRKDVKGGPDTHVLENGFVFINLSWRGTGNSEGSFRPTLHGGKDVTDMEDFFVWLEKQEFFNGNCAMYGGSYPGYTQWCAQKTHHICLKGVAPAVAPIYSCSGPSRPNGGAYTGSMHWIITMHHRTNFGYENIPDYNAMKFTLHLPLIETDEYVYNGEKAPAFKEYLLSSHEPAKMLKDYKEEFSKFRVPAFISGGWFDPFKHQVIESYLLMKETAATQIARKYTRLTMGPWGHGDLENPDIFGAENDRKETTARQRKFLKNTLLAPENDPLPDEELPVRFFMMGENAWYNTEMWPPEGTQEYKLYLHSNGDAVSCDGNGVLNTIAPDTMEKPDVYIADPNDPVSPTNGNHAPKACYDRLFLEKRSDMLVYTTEKFTSPLTMAGKFKLRFYASVSTVDTDFFATLTLVTPEEKSLLATFGMIRARYRNGLEKEEFLTPGEICQYEIDMEDMALQVQPGCALRLEIAGQEFPYYERNANTGNKPFTDKVLLPSTHTIYHDKDHAAELILPVNNKIRPMQ